MASPFSWPVWCPPRFALRRRLTLALGHKDQHMTDQINTGSLIDWVAIGVAGLALAAACWQAREARAQAAITRAHNKITTLPMLVQHEDWDLRDEGLVLRLSLRNVGMGVALVKDRYFTYEKRRFIPQKQGRVVQELADLLFKNFIPFRVLGTSMFGEKAKIPPGTSITLISILFHNPHPELQEVVEGLASKASFEVEYESVYSEQFRFSTND